jgi:hypothetical protein
MPKTRTYVAAATLLAGAAVWLAIPGERVETVAGTTAAEAGATAGTPWTPGAGSRSVGSSQPAAGARPPSGGASPSAGQPAGAPASGATESATSPDAAATGAAGSREARRAAGDVRWSLREARVVSPGETVTIVADRDTGQPGGTLTTGYVLEGKVKAQRGGFVPEGTLLVTLSAFRPDADLPGQKAGLWHVQGKWQVVDAAADPEALKARHNPYVVSGRIKDALPFNPAEIEGAWSARVTVPASWAAGSWVRGTKGKLELGPGGEGDLEVALAVGHGTR